MLNGSSPIVIDDDENDGQQAGHQEATAVQQDVVTSNDCVICYEEYDEDGDHKPVVLKCGHHAGEPCMERWLESKKSCPTCRKPANKRQLRPIYNLPTRGGTANVPPAAAAANPSELAQKELMLQAVQKKYHQDVKRQTEARQHAERELERLAQECKQAERKRKQEELKRKQTEQQYREAEREAKRLKVMMQDLERELAEAKKAAAAVGGAAAAALQAAVAAPHLAAAAQAAASFGFSGFPPSATAASSAQPRGQLGSGPVAPGPNQTQQPLCSPHAGTATGCPNAGAGATAPPLAAAAAHSGGPQPGPNDMWGHFLSTILSAAGPSHNHASQCDGTRGAVGHHPAFTQAGSSSAMGWPQPGGATGSVPNPAAAHGGRNATVADRGGPPLEHMFSVQVRGCRLMALDACGSRVLASETLVGGRTGIRKISMLAPESSAIIALQGADDVLYDLQLPTLHTSGPTRLAAVATKCTGLSLLCTNANAVVATFSGLPFRPWSCSWVPQHGPVAAGAGPQTSTAGYGEHLLLAGLEKGRLALLDLRRTDRAVAVMEPLSLLQQQPGAGSSCFAAMPVRSVVVLPGPAVAQPTEAGREEADRQLQGAGGVTWPACVFSCPKAAWVMTTVANGGAGAAAAPVVVPLGAGHNGMNLESVAVQPLCGGGAARCIPRSQGGEGQGEQACSIALSWKPSGGVASSLQPGTTAEPRHEVGFIQYGGAVHASHEQGMCLTGYTRHGLHSVRSCVLPPPNPTALSDLWDDRSGLLLASSDDSSFRPLVWSLRGSFLGAGYGGLNGGGGNVVQVLNAHPEPPACMVTSPVPFGAYVAGASYLGCASASLVAVYRRHL